MHPAPSPSARYERSVRKYKIWTIVIAVVSLNHAWGVIKSHVVGTLFLTPGNPERTAAIDYVVGAGALVIGLGAVLALWKLMGSRFEIDRLGIRWHKVELPWERVHAVRILVMTRTEPAATGGTLADIWLELSLREPELTPEQQEAVRPQRIPWTATEGYSHHIRIARVEVLRKSEPVDFAPDIQRVLAAVAAPIYQGAVVRRTPATRSVV